MKSALRRALRGKKAFIFLGFVFAAMGSAIALAQPLITAAVIDDAIPSGDIALLTRLAAAFLLSFLASQLFNIGEAASLVYAANGIEGALRSSLFERALRRKALSVRMMETGDFLTRMNSDISECAEFRTATLAQALIQLVMLAASSIILAGLDVRVALIVFGFAPVVLAVNELFVGKFAKMQRERKRAMSDLSCSLEQSWSNRFAIAAGRAFDYASSKMNESQQGVYGNRYRIMLFRSWTGSLKSFVSLMPSFLIVFLGGYWIMRGEMTIGTIVAATSYIGNVYGPLKGLIDIRMVKQSYNASRERLQSLLDGAESEKESPIPPGRAVETSVEIRELDFSYPAEERPVIECLSFVHEGPGLVRVLGHNGSGKSTLFHLLSGSLLPDSGSVRVCGVDPGSAGDDFAGILSFVPQETAIFQDTVLGNITLGRNAGFSARDAIASVPGRYPARLDPATPPERGVSAGGNDLSGGQKRRIALIRALVADPPVVLMDEPFTGLDADARKDLLGWIQAASKSKLVFLIDHSIGFECDATVDLRHLEPEECGVLV